MDRTHRSSRRSPRSTCPSPGPCPASSAAATCVTGRTRWAWKTPVAYTPTYAYEFNDENAPELYLPPLGFPYGAAHASEIQYLFTLSNVAYPAALTRAQQQLAAVMKGDWTNLATFGAPGFGWPRFTSSDPQWQSLVPPRPQLETDFAAEHHCAFWAAA